MWVRASWRSAWRAGPELGQPAKPSIPAVAARQAAGGWQYTRNIRQPAIRAAFWSAACSYTLQVARRLVTPLCGRRQSRGHRCGGGGASQSGLPLQQALSRSCGEGAGSMGAFKPCVGWVRAEPMRSRVWPAQRGKLHPPIGPPTLQLIERCWARQAAHVLRVKAAPAPKLPAGRCAWTDGGLRAWGSSLQQARVGERACWPGPAAPPPSSAPLDGSIGSGSAREAVPRVRGLLGPAGAQGLPPS